jgi:hypothetical protein
MGVGGNPGPPACTPTTVASASILDFTSGTSSFGTFNGVVFSGGTYSYPGPSSGTCDPASYYCSDYAGMNWHMTGLVKDYSGFGLYFMCKTSVTPYTGIQFDISGTFTGNGMGTGTVPSPSVTFNVGTPADDVAAQYTSTPTTPSWGACIPTTGNQYDGSCAAPSQVIPLSATPTTVMVPWSGFTTGKPSPTPDPANITSFSWALPWTGAGAAQYTVDITVDNIKFY